MMDVYRLVVLFSICVPVVESTGFFFNDSILSKNISSRSTNTTSKGRAVKITCGILNMAVFSISIYRCVYRDWGICGNTTKEDCLLYRAILLPLGLSEVRYCGCQYPECHRLDPKKSARQYSITLDSATCQDAGRYMCRTEAIDSHVSEGLQSLEMFPGEVKLLSNLTNRGAGGAVLTGSMLSLRCFVFTTLPVYFIWTFQDSGVTQWHPVSSGMASVQSNSPPQKLRCDVPWISILRRRVDVRDGRRRYRCAVTYTYRNRAFTLRSPEYILNAEVLATPAYTTVLPSDPASALRDNHSRVPGGNRHFILQQRNRPLMVKEPPPLASVPAVLACLAVLVVGGLLCLTVMLLTESNMLHWSLTFFRQHPPTAAFARQGGFRMPSRPITLAGWMGNMMSFGTTGQPQGMTGDTNDGIRGRSILSENHSVAADRGNRRSNHDEGGSWHSVRQGLTQGLNAWANRSSTNRTDTPSQHHGARNTAVLSNTAGTRSIVVHRQNFPSSSHSTFTIMTIPRTPAPTSVAELNEPATTRHAITPQYVRAIENTNDATATKSLTISQNSTVTASTSSRENSIIRASTSSPVRLNSAVTISTSSTTRENARGKAATTTSPLLSQKNIRDRTATKTGGMSPVNTTNTTSPRSSPVPQQDTGIRTATTSAAVPQSTSFTTAASDEVPQNNSATASSPARENSAPVMTSTSRAVPQNTSVIATESNTAQQNTSVIAKESNTAQQNTSVIATESNTAQQNTCAIATESNTAQQNTSVIATRSNTAQQNTSVIATESNTAQQNTSVIATRSNTAQQNTSAIATRSNTAQQNTSAIATRSNTAQQNTSVTATESNTAQQNTSAIAATTSSTAAEPSDTPAGPQNSGPAGSRPPHSVFHLSGSDEVVMTLSPAIHSFRQARW